MAGWCRENENLEGKRKGTLFYELYEKYKNVMYRAAFKVVKNDADTQDAVQNAMLCILNKMEELPSQEEKRNAYVIVTTRHAAIDIYRANRKQLRLCNNLTEDILRNGQRYGADPFKHTAAQEKRDYLLEILKKLNEDYCEIILFYYFYNCSMRQIGDTLGLTEKATTTKLHRARKALEKELEWQGIGAQGLELLGLELRNGKTNEEISKKAKYE